MTARQIINRRLRFIGIIPTMVILLFVLLLLLYNIESLSNPRVPWGLIMGMVLIFAGQRMLLRPFAKCPHCGGNIYPLLHYSSISKAYLSRKVSYCPLCAKDFDTPVNSINMS